MPVARPRQAPRPIPDLLIGDRKLRFLNDEMTRAERMGVTRQTVVAIEKENYSPSLEVAFRIAGVFDVPLEAYFASTMTDVPGLFAGPARCNHSSCMLTAQVAASRNSVFAQARNPHS